MTAITMPPVPLIAVHLITAVVNVWAATLIGGTIGSLVDALGAFVIALIMFVLSFVVNARTLLLGAGLWSDAPLWIT